MGDFFYGLTRAIWALFITLIFGDDATGTVGVLGNGMKTWIGEEAAAGEYRLFIAQSHDLLGGTCWLPPTAAGL